MINVIGGDEFLDGSQILLGVHFLEETAHQGLVVFGLHSRDSFLYVASFTKDGHMSMP